MARSPSGWGVGRLCCARGAGGERNHIGGRGVEDLQSKAKVASVKWLPCGMVLIPVYAPGSHRGGQELRRQLGAMLVELLHGCGPVCPLGELLGPGTQWSEVYSGFPQELRWTFRKPMSG